MADASEENLKAPRPDPVFKLLTRQEAERHGLQLGETEVQYSTLADLVLLVPPEASLQNTMFDFFRPVNVLEFKSQGDQLDLKEYIRNQIRTDIQFLRGKELEYRNVLNVIVSSRRPKSFLEYASQVGVAFTPEIGKPWLLRGQVGFQAVAIVICSELPLEERYYQWLVFAPTDTLKWRNYVIALFRKQNQELLRYIKTMRPKEYSMINSEAEIVELLKAEGFITAEYEAWVEQELMEATRRTWPRISKQHPEVINELLSQLPPEERLAGLDPEQRLAGLDPEQRLAGLDPEEEKELYRKLSEKFKGESPN